MASGAIGVMSGEFEQPRIDCRVLFESHVSEYDSHADDSQPASRMLVNHLAGQLAGVGAIANGKIKFRADGNRLERIDIAAARTYLRNLRGHPCAVL